METRVLSLMAKVFGDGIPARYHEQPSVTGLHGERLGFQVAYSAQTPQNVHVSWTDAPGGQAYCVRSVPVAMPVGDRWDDDYLSTSSGLYPDLLEPLPVHGRCRALPAWQTLLFVFDALPVGEYNISVRFCDENGIVIAERVIPLTNLPVTLLPQTLKYTRWFHCDALAEYYHVAVFSDRHFQIIGNFLKAAVKQGMNMVLTPIHTPPLDTAVGKERTTVQLVDIRVQGNTYHFNFDKLDRWVALCDTVGIRYFEMAHLYTQWGALAAPQIVAEVEGVHQRIFGWDTPATGHAYATFLAAYLKALTDHLHALGIADRCVFHISDEPGVEDKAHYLAARLQVATHLAGFPIMDALSDVALFHEGIVTLPIPSNDHIADFLPLPLSERWTYYCCGQLVDVSNSLIAMPGERTRVLGIQMYRHDVCGFLQWGLNFYYTERANALINPFLTTDGNSSWPAGDPFNLYPGVDGQPLESQRSLLMGKAMEDMRVLQTLEARIGRDAVCALIDRTAGHLITFSHYPHDEQFILTLRKHIHEALVGGEV